MNFKTENKIYKIAAIIISISIAISSFGYYYYNAQYKSGIYDFNEQRDAPFISELFKNDWYWLVAGVSDTYDQAAENYVKHFIKNQTTAHLAANNKKVTIKVAYEDNNFVGFIAYFLKKFYLGKLLFIDVLPTYRSKNWGYRLLKYAIDDLTKQGVLQIELVTRTDNLPAQKLYNRFGFKETNREDGFVNFAYTI